MTTVFRKGGRGQRLAEPLRMHQALCGLMAAGLLSLSALALAQDGAAVGLVAKLRGSADAIRANQPPVALAENDSVYRSDVLMTRDHSLLEVALNDGSTFTLAENTRVVIAEFVPGDEPRGLLSLTRGRLRSSVAEAFSSRRDSYRVQTREGVMGVQGTEFDVMALALETQVYVYAGIVSVTHRDPAFPGTRLLYAGQMVTITGNEPVPEPSTFLDAEASAIGSGGGQDLLSGGRQMDDPTASIPAIPGIGDSDTRVPPLPNPPER